MGTHIFGSKAQGFFLREGGPQFKFFILLKGVVNRDPYVYKYFFVIDLTNSVAW